MQVSWIDPDEITALANQLLEPLPNETDSRGRTQPLPEESAAAPLIAEKDEATSYQNSTSPVYAFGEASPELEQIRAKLRTIRDRAKDAGLLPSASSSSLPDSPPAVAAPLNEDIPPAADKVEPALPVSDEVAIPEGTIAERLDFFSRWALPQLNSNDFLLLDDHGDILWGVPKGRAELKVQAMVMLRRARQQDHLTPHQQVLHSQGHNGLYLSVVQTPTRHGNVILASFAAAAPSEQLCTKLADVLTLAVNGAQVDAASS